MTRILNCRHTSSSSSCIASVDPFCRTCEILLFPHGRSTMTLSLSIPFRSPKPRRLEEVYSLTPTFGQELLQITIHSHPVIIRLVASMPKVSWSLPPRFTHCSGCTSAVLFLKKSHNMRNSSPLLRRQPSCQRGFDIAMPNNRLIAIRNRKADR